MHDENGDRVYNEFWTAEKWEKEEARWGSKFPIVWLVLWSDKASYDRMNRSQGHPLTVCVANTAIEYQRQAEGCKLLALLPKVSPLRGEQVSDSSFKARKAAVMQMAMKVAIERLKKATAELHDFTWPDGSRTRCRVRLAAFLAELEEQWQLLGLKQAGTAFPDVMCLIPADRITDVSEAITDWPVRTEEDHKSRLHMYRKANSALRDLRDKAIAALDEVSMHPLGEDVALWGFGPDNNIYLCFPVDRLHQDYNGVTKHMLTSLVLYLEHHHGSKTAAAAVKAEINYRLSEMRGLHEAFYPSDGMDAVNAMAEERRGLMKFMAVALNGSVDVQVVDLYADYARWQELRDQSMHTPHSLALLEERTDALIRDITTIFGGLGKNWNIPKMANMRKYASAIREMGMISFADTGPKERLNKDLRAAYNATNRKLTGLNQQVANKMQLREALQQATKSNLTAAPKRATGARQRAAAAWQPSLSPSGKLFHFAKMTH